MSISKAIFIGSISLFAVIGGLAVLKKNKERETRDFDKVAVIEQDAGEPIGLIQERSEQYLAPVQDEIANQEEDQISRLFTVGRQKLPLVETIQYKARVSWLKDRPAWISDYASYYATSRHFIARSLNRKKDYDAQKISPGDHFNVLKKDVSFYLVVDLSRCKMWFYGIDELSNTRILLKTYKVGVGRFDPDTYSGILTPKGKFSLGHKIAIYKPGMEGYFQDAKVEMVRVFGTRWIPFSEELSGAGDHPRGYGFHGAPWVYDIATESYREDLSTIGGYDSDGCIRLTQNDIEELYAIVITKPTVVEIVSDFHDAEIPGEPVDK